jgi:hypothetical protein
MQFVRRSLKRSRFHCTLRLNVALFLLLVLVTGFAHGCGSVKSLFGDDDRNVSGIADYGTTSNKQPTSGEDPELEAFWMRIADLSRELPPHQAGRLQVNLRDLRIRVDRPTAELVLICGRRLLDANDLNPFLEAGSQELALMLEQFSGDGLMRQLRFFSTEPLQSFQGFLDNSITVKPPDLLSEQLRRGREALDAVAASPEILPKSGNYIAAPVISIASTTPLARIHYTLDNSEPDENSPIYTEPIVIPDDKEFVVVKARCYAEGFITSEVSLSTYIIQRLQVTKPALSLQSGKYKNAISVSVTNQASGVTVRYTLDGTTPSEQSPILDGSAMVANEGITVLKARGFGSQMLASEVTVASYTIDKHPPVLPANHGITAQNIQGNGFTLSWELATDAQSQQSNLRYIAAIASSASIINSSAQVLAINTPCDSDDLPCVSGMLPSLPGITYSARGLHTGTQYSVSLIVLDEAGHSTHYGTIFVTTADN